MCLFLISWGILSLLDRIAEIILFTTRLINDNILVLI